MTWLQEKSRSWLEPVPQTWEAVHLAEPGLRGVFFESVPYRGVPTRVFAWIGLPEGACPEHPVPGMVLIHGGGGSAFARWVRWWTRRGYAAIAMDTRGAMPLQDTGARGAADWPRHAYSGPASIFDQLDQPPEDQWACHAAAAVIKAHTLLASLPEVVSDRIGLTGISVGGYLSCLVAGLDPRLRCAMPVYGCAFTEASEGGLFSNELSHASEARRRFWLDNWAAATTLPQAACPMLWLNGSNDGFFYPPEWQRSAACTRGPRQLCFKLRYPHGHIPESEEAPELAAFADACLRGGRPLLSIIRTSLENGVLRAWHGGERAPLGATLLLTLDSGPWPKRQWHMLPAEMDSGSRTVAARLPEGTTAACLSIVAEDWLTSTGDLVFPG